MKKHRPSPYARALRARGAKVGRPTPIAELSDVGMDDTNYIITNPPPPPLTKLHAQLGLEPDWHLYRHAIGVRLGIPFPLVASPNWKEHGYAAYRAWLADVGEVLLLNEPEFQNAPGRPKGRFSQTPPKSKNAKRQARYRKNLRDRRGNKKAG
jgi:hypothetical protein